MTPDKVFCCKCKSKTDCKDGREEMSKKGQRMYKCVCTDCGTKKCTFLKKDDRVPDVVEEESFDSEEEASYDEE